jgi:hypothetical protein
MRQSCDNKRSIYLSLCSKFLNKYSINMSSMTSISTRLIFSVGFCILLFVINSYSQTTIEGISNKVDLNITKDPPVLLLSDGSLKFTDQNGNNCIDANEMVKISFEVENRGKGEASGLTLNVSETGNIGGLSFGKIASKGNLSTSTKKTIEIPITGDMNLKTGVANFVIKLDEEGGFGLDEMQMEVKTMAFVNPVVKIPDYTITSEIGNTLNRKKPFDLQILIQNVGKGIAESVRIDMSIPQNVLCFSGNETTQFDKIISGETQTIVYSLIVNERYLASSIPVEFKLSEKYGKYAENKTITLELNQAMAASKLIVESSVIADNTLISEAYLGSDVDKNIPFNSMDKPNTYALIIGNEDYYSFQSGLSREINVDYAMNDARTIKEYCSKTLGIPDKQIMLLTNATTGKMNQGITWLSNLAKVDNGKAELIFYYSGHGLPDEVTKEAYLIPVDVSGSNLTEGIKLADVYSKLSEYPAQKVTVFLDACFSGGARNQGLIAQKSVKIKPKENLITGNMVVFTSSTGEESSGVYREKQHGYMTYYLLKKLQETKGDITYGELANYITDKVTKETALSGKTQTPQVIYSSAIENTWTNWMIK